MNAMIGEPVAEFSEERIAKGLDLLRRKLGQDLYDAVTIVTEEQIVCLEEIIFLLDGESNVKGIRKWFTSDHELLTDSRPIELFNGDWDPNDNLVKSLKDNLLDVC